MLASITPVGESARRQPWIVTVTAYLAGSAAGGAAVGVVAGAIGAVLGAGGWGVPGLVLLGVVAVLGAVSDARRRGAAAPSWRRQVDERWLTTYRGWVYGAGYGLQLGAGVVTIVPSAVTYVALLAAVLTGSPVVGAVIGVVFGVVRALPVLVAGVLREGHQLQRLHRRLDAVRRPVGHASVGAQFVVGTLVLAVATVSTAVPT